MSVDGGAGPLDPAHQPVTGTGTGSAALRLQVLSTEHWSLLASRQLAWSESFARASMFLMTLSGSLVALALVAQAQDFGRDFEYFALAILPVVVFVGLTTFLRLGASNYHDAQCVIGMNRIRGAYLEIAPDLRPYFVMSPHDDVRGVGVSMGMDPRANQVAHMVSATPAVVAIVTTAVAAALGAVAGDVLLGGSVAGRVVGAVVVAGVVFGFAATSARRAITGGQASVRPMFPSAPEATEPG